MRLQAALADSGGGAERRTERWRELHNERGGEKKTQKKVEGER